MCITTHPADLSNTKIYAGEARLGETYVHVMAYRNTAATEGPNAMILPIPAARMLGPANVIDTREFAGFLDIMLAEAEDCCRGAFGGVPESPQVFDVGSYTVVLAQRPQAIARAVEGVPANKRPSLNPALLQAFDDLYPGWPLAVCCWDGAIEAEPMLWWYEPKSPEWLFAPALDAHHGGAPDIGAEVRVDHVIGFGSTLREQRFGGWEDELPPIAADLLAWNVRRARVAGHMPNGDFWQATAALGGPAQRRAPGAAESTSIPLA
jgi:hypothetical protein